MDKYDETHFEVDYFQQLTDGSPVMIWMSGHDMGCYYFNKSWLNFRGRSLEQEFGNGWAEGVHPDDMERCVEHYVGSFRQKLPFAMSYRLLHHSGEYRWILDRGAPHYSATGEFLGFYGGCAETAANASIHRLSELRVVIHEMQDFAAKVAAHNAPIATAGQTNYDLETQSSRLAFARRALSNAATNVSKLATDMLTYEKIELGACVH